MVKSKQVNRESDHDLSLAKAQNVLRQRSIAVLIVAYNAESHIFNVLNRIPKEIAALLAEICIIDDCSRDATFDVAVAAAEKLGLENVSVFRTPANQGYGGNQKIGYTYAIRSKHDVVVMLHGDGQYPPEYLPQMIAPFDEANVEVVLGSRMITRRNALRGGMPLYKWLGNQVLTVFENIILKADLTEYHTGYRAYATRALQEIAFKFNSNDFHFDTQILIQLIARSSRIVEIPIPTHYGNEICHVNGLSYAWNCVKSVIKYRLFCLGLFYSRFLDSNLFENKEKYVKKAGNSLHGYIRGKLEFNDQNVLVLGDAGGWICADISGSNTRLTAISTEAQVCQIDDISWHVKDIDFEFDKLLDRNSFDTAVVLDIIENFKSPEQAVEMLSNLIKSGGRLVISFANIAYFISRIMLFMGEFNYSKRGILDLNHRRLFTVRTLRQLLTPYNFEIKVIKGFGPPIRDMISGKWPYSWIDTVLSGLARLYKSVFAFNFLVIAVRRPSLEEIYDNTVNTPEKR